jgi:hypothetical protein
MSDGSKGEDKAAPESTPPPTAPKVSTWKLPDGIEDHLAKGCIAFCHLKFSVALSSEKWRCCGATTHK